MVAATEVATINKFSRLALSKRVFYIFLAVIIVGLPVITLWQALTLIMFTLCLYTAVGFRKVSLKALSVSFMLTMLAHLLPVPIISETSHVYFPQVQNKSTQYPSLPASVQTYLHKQFTKFYGKGPGDSAGMSWQAHVSQPTSVAFSPEAIWQEGGGTRSVEKINFYNYKGFRAGFVNENSATLGEYNFYGGVRENKLVRKNMPFFVKYQFDKSLAESKLCWQGAVFIHKGQGFVKETHQRLSCMTLAAIGSPMTVIGVSFPGKQLLAMQFKPSLYWQSLRWVRLISILVALGALLTLFKYNYKRLLSSLFYCGVALLVIDGLQGYLSQFADTPVIMGGQDGLIYQGLGREIVHYLIQGDFYEALRGGVDIFYYMPGMRYVCALQSMLFGDTLLGFFILEVWFLFVIRKISFMLFKSAQAVSLLVVFLMVSAKSMTQYAIHFNAEIAGFSFFAAALLYGLQSIRLKSVGKLGLASLLFSLAVCVRPNLLFGAVACLLFSASVLWSGKRVSQLILALLPFSLVGLVALHNFYYGHQFVVFTSSALIPQNLVLLPQQYWFALKGLLQGVFDHAASSVFRHLFVDWLNHGLYLIPLILTLALACTKKLSPLKRAVVLTILGMQLPSLFWVTGGRYTYLAWLLSYLLALDVMFTESANVIKKLYLRWVFSGRG